VVLKPLQTIINGSKKHCKRELVTNIDFKKGSMLKDRFRFRGSGSFDFGMRIVDCGFRSTVQRSEVLGSRIKKINIVTEPEVSMA
jgi:hypothetical protein